MIWMINVILGNQISYVLFEISKFQTFSKLGISLSIPSAVVVLLKQDKSSKVAGKPQLRMNLVNTQEFVFYI